MSGGTAPLILILYTGMSSHIYATSGSSRRKKKLNSVGSQTVSFFTFRVVQSPVGASKYYKKDIDSKMWRNCSALKIIKPNDKVLIGKIFCSRKQQNMRLHFTFYLIVTQKQYAVLKAIPSLYNSTEVWFLKVVFLMLPKLERFLKQNFRATWKN